MRSDRNRSSSELPAVVYVVLVGLVLWMVLAAWGFAAPDYADVALTVVTGFFVVLIAIPFILWRVARANRDPTEPPKRRIGFADWAAGDFETWQDRLKGAHAAIEITLPIAAAAVGMTAFAIAFHYAAHHVSA
jgi:hypothetical protein